MGITCAFAMREITTLLIQHGRLIFYMNYFVRRIIYRRITPHNMIWGLLIWFIIFLAGLLLALTGVGAIIGIPIMFWSGTVYILYYGLGKGKWAFWQDW